MRCVCQCGVPNASLSQSTLVSFTSCLNSGGYMEISILHLSQRCPYFGG